MNCKQARQAAALLAGGELRNDRQLQEHLGRCGECRDHEQRLDRSMLALRSCTPAGDADEDRETVSLWPGLAARLGRVRPRTTPLDRFNGWIPASVTIAACLLIGLYLVQQPVTPQRHYLDGTPMVERPMAFNPSELPGYEMHSGPTNAGFYFGPPVQGPGIDRSGGFDRPYDERQLRRPLDELFTMPRWYRSFD